MTTFQKMALSIAGVFLGGATSFYQVHLNDDPMTVRFWIGLVMAGLAPVGGYLLGFYQLNPVNQPHTPEALLEAIRKSDISPTAKRASAAAIGRVVVSEAGKPEEKT